MSQPLSEPRNDASTTLRPRGTTALIAGLVLLAVGLPLWVIGLAGGSTAAGGVGFLSALAGVGYLIAGAVLRLAGGASRPVRLRRTVSMAAGIPLLLVLALGLLEWSTSRGATGMFG